MAPRVEKMELWYTAKNENGQDVEFCIEVSHESEIDKTIEKICQENKWDAESVEDSPYQHGAD